jgi:hypothetical protein
LTTSEIVPLFSPLRAVQKLLARVAHRPKDLLDIEGIL